jgi:lipopolysaccharide export LptBFGC system permease protein LptF
LLAGVSRIGLYIARQMLPWAAASLACAALLFIVTQLLRIAPILLGADATAGEIARDLSLLLVPVSAFALSPAFAVAVFAVGGRMSEDGELAALDAAGVPRAATALGPLAVAFVFALGSAALWLVASPAACRILRDDAIRLSGRAVEGRIVPGRFAEPIPGVTVFADAVDGRRLEGVLVDDARDPARSIQIAAASAELRGGGEGALAVAFEKGDAFVAGTAGGGGPVSIRFESLELHAPSSGAAGAIDAFLPETFARGTSALLGPPPPEVEPSEWRFALWRRIAGPLGFLALAAASTGLAFAVPWRRRGFAIGIAALLFLGFHATGRLAEQLLAEGSLGPAAAALAPGVTIVAAAALVLLAQFRCSKRANGV